MVASGTLASPVRWYRSAVEADATAWGVGASGAWIAMALPLLVAVGAGALVPFRSVFLWLTAEDSVVEWLQFGAIVGIAFSFAVLALRTRRRYPWFAALAAVIALGALFVAGEEISWGQRIFGWATPAELEEVNRQGESNIHNILSVQRAFGLAELLAAAYGLTAPIAIAILARRHELPGWRYLVVPPLFLASAFAIAFAYRAARLTLLADAGRSVNRLGEVAELLLYAAILVFAVLALRRSGTESEADGSGPSPSGRADRA